MRVVTEWNQLKTYTAVEMVTNWDDDNNAISIWSKIRSKSTVQENETIGIGKYNTKMFLASDKKSIRKSCACRVSQCANSCGFRYTFKNSTSYDVVKIFKIFLGKQNKEKFLTVIDLWYPNIEKHIRVSFAFFYQIQDIVLYCNF